MSDSQTSKFLSYVLRHKPDAIGLTLDANGWADLGELIALADQSGTKIDEPTVRRVVAASDKQRFALSDDGTRIRANQGHSIDVDLELQPQPPPDVLFHGTADRFVDGIRQDGLRPMTRKHVHLSATEATAVQVGSRHGRPVVLRVRAGDMHRAGRAFFISANGVWLVDFVDPEFLVFPDSEGRSL